MSPRVHFLYYVFISTLFKCPIELCFSNTLCFCNNLTLLFIGYNCLYMYWNRINDDQPIRYPRTACKLSLQHLQNISQIWIEVHSSILWMEDIMAEKIASLLSRLKLILITMQGSMPIFLINIVLLSNYLNSPLICKPKLIAAPLCKCWPTT